MTTKTKLKAFHGDPALKDRVVKAMIADIELENLIKGEYLYEGKGCHVGCVIKEMAQMQDADEIGNDYHQEYETQIGVPEELAHLFDRLFEGCSDEFSKQFSVRILEAIPVGADLSGVADELKLWILRNELHYEREKWPDVTAAIEGAASLLERRLSGDLPTEEEWSAARAAARAATWYAAGDAAAWAAWSATWSAESATWSAESAARDAARAAESAAWSACAAAWAAAWYAAGDAESAARYAAESAAWYAAGDAESAAYERIADHLLVLLSKAI